MNNSSKKSPEPQVKIITKCPRCGRNMPFNFERKEFSCPECNYYRASRKPINKYTVRKMARAFRSYQKWLDEYQYWIRTVRHAVHLQEIGRISKEEVKSVQDTQYQCWDKAEACRLYLLKAGELWQ